MYKKYKPTLTVVTLFEDGSEICKVLSSREANEHFYWLVEMVHLCYVMKEPCSVVSITLRDSRCKTLKQFVNRPWSDTLKLRHVSIKNPCYDDK